ncbi:four helix bundle protein [Pedobacter sp. G11]|uniref:four helix bundle protein n=1 Tax=Pedobacter sp. G11 TaxID=2482728 RepID=UPI000F5DBC3F|nr:four helix bundle protein [Pedobacter sp. G11]AZI25313.1 four helix bundle protein [Pedobacter sp. G11]
MQNFKDLKVWEKSHQLTLSIYKTSAKFPKEEVYSLTNQLRRASASIPANIAEGCGKNSQADLAKFLSISLGSANETEYFLILSRDLDYLTEEQFTVLSNSINEVKAMLINLISRVRAPKPIT